MTQIRRPRSYQEVVVADLDEEYATQVAAYIEAVCLPLLDAVDRPSLRVEHVGAMMATPGVFRVTAAHHAIGCLIGRDAVTADAIRALALRCARTIGWRARIDVRIDSGEPLPSR